MNNLQDQLAAVQSKLNAERELGGQKDADKIAALEAQEADLTRQIMEQAHQGRVSDAQEQSNYLLDDIHIAGVKVEECGIDATVFSILRSKIQAKFVAQAESYSDLIKGYEEREVQLQRQNVEIQKDHAELQATHTAYVKEQEQKVYQFELEIEDAEVKRNNAVAQLEEANAEIERLSNQVDEQRKVIALGVSGSLKVVESTDVQIARQEAELKASRIKVISMVKSDPSGISDRLWDIVFLETGEKLTINYLDKGKYTLIGEEDAARFRQELADKAQREAEQQASIPDLAGDQVVAELDMPEQIAIAGVESEKPFPEDSANTEGLLVDGDSTQGAVVGQADQESQVGTYDEPVFFTVRHADAILELEKRIEALEAKVA